MKPTHLQRLFASKWLLRAWFVSTSVAAAALCLAGSGFRIEHVKDLPLLGWYLLITPLAAALGIILGVFPGVIFVAPLLHVRGLFNGAPFREGDTVQVITGPHAGTVTRVYSGWQGDSVRIDLGGVAAETYADVVSPTEILRMNDKSPNAAAADESGTG